MTDRKSTVEDRRSTSHPDQIDARAKLRGLYEECKLLPDDMLENLGMFVRGSVLARFLEFDAMYRRILDLPGVIMEFGTWFGQGTILTENLRAVHEPFNKQRKIISFDTFDGFAGFSEEDGKDKVFKPNAYSHR